jgi:hypothetical protein
MGRVHLLTLPTASSRGLLGSTRSLNLDSLRHLARGEALPKRYFGYALP